MNWESAGAMGPGAAGARDFVSLPAPCRVPNAENCAGSEEVLSMSPERMGGQLMLGMAECGHSHV